MKIEDTGSDLVDCIDSQGMCSYSLEYAFSSDFCFSPDLSFCINRYNVDLPLNNTESMNLIHQSTVGLITRYIYEKRLNGYIWAVICKKPLASIMCHISPNWSQFQMIVNGQDENIGELLYLVLADFFACAVLNLQSIVLHGAVMDYHGHGIILSAPSKTGKTTHANLWVEMGLTRIINGDRALCRKRDNYWMAYGMPWCGSSGQSINAEVPVAAVVFLQQDDQNSIELLKASEAVLHLLNNTLAPRWEPVLFQAAIECIEEIISSVPVYLLRCRPDQDAVMTLKREMDRLLSQSDTMGQPQGE